MFGDSEDKPVSENEQVSDTELVEEEGNMPGADAERPLDTDKPQSVESDFSSESSPLGEALEEEESDSDEEDEEIPQKKSVLKKLDPERAALPWYAVHTYSGYENRVKLSLEERIRSAKLEHKFGNVIMPQETVEELVRGKKKQSSRKLFPGYIMVQMHLDDESWHLVNATPKVTGFVGDSRKPLPLTDREVGELLSQIEGGGARPRPRVQYEEGDAVKVIDGPFSDFNGTVDEVRPDKGKLRVLISIFGRNTPVELDFVQVEKL